MKDLFNDVPEREYRGGAEIPPLDPAAQSSSGLPDPSEEPSVTVSDPGWRDDHERQQAELLQVCFKTVQHFFGGFEALLKGIDDPRRLRDGDYPLPVLLFTGALMFLCRLGSRRQVGHILRGTRAAETIAALFKVDQVPHGDTLNNAFLQLAPDELQESVCRMVEQLIRAKTFDRYRVEGRFVVAIDGTGILTFSNRHCSDCLTKTHKGQVTYYHPVLEAKLVTASGIVLSMMSEFIENSPGQGNKQGTKQDCELRAFYRLAGKLKKRFPKLPLLLSLDGLFAGGPTFALCEKHDWKFMIVLKDDSLKSVNQEFVGLLPLQPENRLALTTGDAKPVRQDLSWVNKIEYVDTEGLHHQVGVLQCLETKSGTTSPEKTSMFRWVTNFQVSPKSAMSLANDGGRNRWKIENEGFNVQKTGGYALEHAYTTDPTAAKVFYFLLQAAHAIAQLLEKGSLLKKAFPAGFGSAKNLAYRLLEAWRNVTNVTRELLSQLFAQRIQIRFNTS